MTDSLISVVLVILWTAGVVLTTVKYLRAVKSGKKADAWIWFVIWCLFILFIEWPVFFVYSIFASFF